MTDINNNMPKQKDEPAKASKYPANSTNVTSGNEPKGLNQGSTPKATKQFMKIMLVAGFILLGVILVSWLMLRNSNIQIVTHHDVCGADVVTKYNTVSRYTQRNSSEEYTIDEEGLKNLAGDIKSRQDYQKDPTCQTILLEVAIYNKDINAANEAYKSLNELHDKQKYVDSNLKSEQLYAYENIIQRLSSTEQEEGNQEPQGGS